MAYLLSDVLNTIKKSMPKDLKNANPEELMGALGSLKDLANSVSQDMNQNASEETKKKYADGFESLNNMIEKGIENPEGDIDTSGLDEYITVAKSSKKAKKAIDNIEK